MIYIFRFGNTNRYRAVGAKNMREARSKVGYEKGVHFHYRLPFEKLDLYFQQGDIQKLPSPLKLRDAI